MAGSLPRVDAARRNARDQITSAPAARPPRLRSLKDHHPDTRRFWKQVCASPQSGLFGPATWEWLQAKMWRLDAFFADPTGAPTALARELDDIAAKLILLPRDAVARGFTPASMLVESPATPRGAARGRRTSGRRERLLSAVGDAP